MTATVALKLYRVEVWAALARENDLAHFSGAPDLVEAIAARTKKEAEKEARGILAATLRKEWPREAFTIVAEAEEFMG